MLINETIIQSTLSNNTYQKLRQGCKHQYCKWACWLVSTMHQLPPSIQNDEHGNFCSVFTGKIDSNHLPTIIHENKEFVIGWRWKKEIEIKITGNWDKDFEQDNKKSTVKLILTTLLTVFGFGMTPKSCIPKWGRILAVLKSKHLAIADLLVSFFQMMAMLSLILNLGMFSLANIW